MPLLIYFTFILVAVYRKKSVLTILLLLQIVSLSASIPLHWELSFFSFKTFFNIFFIGLCMSIVFFPWRHYRKITRISVSNPKKIDFLSKILFIISGVIFITLLISAIFVLTQIKNIHDFKYTEGALTDFIYTQLPISHRFYLFSYYLYPLSYFLIPLHFYYLKIGNKLFSRISLILSLNIILFGLTFFSRWTLTHYTLIYSTFLFLFWNNLSKIGKRRIFILLSVILTFLILRFTAITQQRFENDISYHNKIPATSKIQDPVIYNYFDYISQWYYNGLNVLEEKGYQTLKGKHSLQPILSLLNTYGLISFDNSKLINEKWELMGGYYSKFNGLIPWLIVDFGYLITLFLSIFYNRLITRIKPVNGIIKIEKLFLVVLLIQLPLFSIFYSFLGGILIPLVFFVFIKTFLRTNLKDKKRYNSILSKT